LTVLWVFFTDRIVGRIFVSLCNLTKQRMKNNQGCLKLCTGFLHVR